MSSKTQQKMKNCFADLMCTCEICGKEFIRTPEYLYSVKCHDKKLYFCRYNHYVQWLKEHGRW